MKEKLMAATVVTIILISTLALFAPVRASPDIKIGIIGPQGLPHWSPNGMKEGAEIAAKEINDAGGINVSGTFHNISLVFENEYSYPTISVPDAQASIQSLYDSGCRFMVGGFRTEVTGPMIEKAMTQLEPVVYIINGAATNDLMYPILADYNKYKYLFRSNPVNDTMLLLTISAGVQTLAAQMLPLFGCYNAEINKTQVKAAVLTEDLAWTAAMHERFTNESLYPTYFGPYVNVTFSSRIPASAGPIDTSPWLVGVDSVESNNCRIMIHVFSSPTGVYLIAQWAGLGVKAMPIGINVAGQLEDHWINTGGGCEYEAILNFVGTRTPVTPEAVQFWDDFVAYTGGEWPIYLAFGAYNSLYSLKDAIEDAGTLDKDSIVTALESQERDTLTGKAKYTDGTGYISPVIHDIYCNSYGPTWASPQYTRAMICQWQCARMEVVMPVDQNYSKDWAYPPWLYPYRTDVNFDGKVRVDDVLATALAFGSAAGDDRWERRLDVTDDCKIRVDDILDVALDFGIDYSIPLWC
jgi:branched-chain amino acid transport system substrate-binding protein